MAIGSNFATFDIALFTDAAFAELFEVAYYNRAGDYTRVDMAGRTFTMQLRADPADASAAVTITVRPYPTDTYFLEIYGDSAVLAAVTPGRYYFSIVDTTNAGTNGEILIASGNCTILKNPTR